VGDGKLAVARDTSIRVKLPKKVALGRIWGVSGEKAGLGPARTF
jgi:hypothetical protein